MKQPQPMLMHQNVTKRSLLKEIGELYELEKNIEQAMDYYERSADLFQSEEVTTSANQCKKKVAQFAVQLE
ncbi:hypothetical protein AAC387_Pa01g3951 [Persea americana]